MITKTKNKASAKLSPLQSCTSRFLYKNTTKQYRWSMHDAICTQIYLFYVYTETIDGLDL